MWRIMLFLVLLTIPALASDFPRAEISNGLIKAKFYLPDAKTGYYQGTRFDWSGVIYSLEYNGHEYFGQWFPRYDPKIHDAIMGPVEEFLTNNAGLGYTEAKTGGTFIRIGTGVVRKPEEKEYHRFSTYELVDPGKWRIRQGKDWIEFIHELKDASGYAYQYTKTIRLAKNKPLLLLEHRLKNTGRHTIETDQYNHNFFMLGHKPTGPNSTLTFAFNARPLQDFKGAAQIEGKQMTFQKELATGQSVFSELEGFGNSASDNDFRIENREAGIGVHIKGDRPIVKLIFWSIRTTLCPEPYIRMKIEPGKEFKWNSEYSFYTLPAANPPKP